MQGIFLLYHSVACCNSLVKDIRADGSQLTRWQPSQQPRFQRIEWGHIGFTCLHENGKSPLFFFPWSTRSFSDPLQRFTSVSLLRLSIGNRHWPHLLALSSPPPCQASRQLPAELSLSRFHSVFTTRRHLLLEGAKNRSKVVYRGCT